MIGLFLVVPALCNHAAQENVWQAPGVMYYCDNNPRVPLAVHVVRIERGRKDLEFHATLGGSNQIGMAVLSEQVRFIKPSLGQPIAAINGDYFYQYRPFIGDPMNLHINHGGELVSAPGEDRAFFYIDAKGEPRITNAVTAFTVTWPNGKSTPMGINEAPETGQAVLYTSASGPNTRVEGIDLILEDAGKGPWLPLRPGQTLIAKVSQINKLGFSPLKPKTMVLSLSPRKLSLYPPLVPNMELKISMATKPDLTGAIVGIGGGPSIVRGGKLRHTPEVHGGHLRHPRTAFGWNAQYYYFVQVDGRQPRYSMGMTLAELGEYFLKLGCDHAINLDGGGSCTTWVSGRIVNNPAQGRERPSANALVLVRTNKSSK